MKAFHLHALLPFSLAAHLFAAAPNLLVNGDFDNSQLEPWTPTGAVVVSNGMCNLGGNSGSGRIEQTVALVEGNYYLSLDTGNYGSNGNDAILLELTIFSNGAELTSAVHEVPALRQNHYALNFHAPDGPGKIQITATNTVMLVDNVRLLLLPPSPFAGAYKGSAKVTVASSVTTDSDEAVLTTGEKAVARIEPTGRFGIVRGRDSIQGILFKDGTFDLRSQGVRVTGQAVVASGTLRLTLPFAVTDNAKRLFADEGDQEIHVRSQLLITLKRQR